MARRVTRKGDGTGPTMVTTDKRWSEPLEDPKAKKATEKKGK